MSDGAGSKVQALTYLLDEYKYRHDLIWRLLFQLTLTVVVLSYLPYLPYGNEGSIAAVFGVTVLALPGLAVLLTFVGLKVFSDEFDLFWRVVVPYHTLQKTFFAETFSGDNRIKAYEPKDKEKDRFRTFVLFFLAVLCLTTVAHVGGLVWAYRSSRRPFMPVTRSANAPQADTYILKLDSIP